MRTRILAAVLGLLLAGSAQAQKQAPPEGGAPKDFTLPARSGFTLPNGLGVTFIPYGELPKVTVRVVVRAGNVHEGPQEVWLADLAGDFLKEGTAGRDAQTIAQDAARIGGTISVNVRDDQTSIEGEALAEFGPRLVDQLADLVLRPSFPAAELERLKTDRIRQLSIARSDPNNQAMAKFRAVLYPDHPYGRMFPTEAMLKGYTLTQVKGFYDAHFGAGRAHVYVAGKFDRRQMEEAIRKAFGDWAAGAGTDVPPPRAVRGRTMHIVDRPGAPQSTIYIGLPVIDPSHPDYRALLVTDMLLGGSFGSRITSNIREDKGYTYSPGSSVSSRYRDAYWAEFASVTTSVTGAALKEILFEINRLQAEPPSEEELRGIQNYAAGIFTLQNSSPGGIISLLSFLRLHGLPDSYLTEYVKTIYAVTPEDVRRMAQTHLKDEEMLIVIAGDRKAIEKQVAPYGRIAP